MSYLLLSSFYLDVLQCELLNFKNNTSLLHLTFLYNMLVQLRDALYRLDCNKGFVMKKYVCTLCDWVYDPAVGDPDGGIEPGTAFEDIPEDWVCPDCGATKDDFEVINE